MANRCRTFLRQQSKTPKHVIRMCVSLGSWEVDVGRYSRTASEVPLRQQSKTPRHVLRIYVTLATWEIMEKTIFRSHLECAHPKRKHVSSYSSRIYVSEMMERKICRSQLECGHLNCIWLFFARWCKTNHATDTQSVDWYFAWVLQIDVQPFKNSMDLYQLGISLGRMKSIQGDVTRKSWKCFSGNFPTNYTFK